VRVYEAVYPPHHPLLGLQLYTLGDLYARQDNGGARKLARAALERAARALEVTHGEQHELPRGARALLSELNAEEERVVIPAQ
jgi:hypothetical protein